MTLLKDHLPQGSEPHHTRYIRFIESRPKDRKKTRNGVYLERHHILPKSLGGSNEKDNIIILTAKEHFIAHLILWKCYGGPMAQALYYMMNKKSTTGRHGSVLSSRQYERVKQESKISVSTKLKGRPAHNKGIPHSEETKKKIGESSKGRHHSEESKDKIRKANTGNTYTKGTKLSEEAKRKLSDLSRGRPKSEAHKTALREASKKRWQDPLEHEKISFANIGRISPNKGKHMSDEQKEKLRMANIGRVTSEETKRKQSIVKLGKKKSKETIERMKIAAQRRAVDARLRKSV